MKNDNERKNMSEREGGEAERKRVREGERAKDREAVSVRENQCGRQCTSVRETTVHVRERKSEREPSREGHRGSNMRERVRESRR